MTRRQPIFEHTSKPLLDRRSFLKRQFRFVFYAFAFLAICLAIGMIGYHSFTHMDWISAYQNATMILSGMGEIDKMESPGAKIFSGSYALFSGVVFVVTIAVMISPLVHRFLHFMHLEDSDNS